MRTLTRVFLSQALLRWAPIQLAICSEHLLFPLSDGTCCFLANRNSICAKILPDCLPRRRRGLASFPSSCGPGRPPSFDWPASKLLYRQWLFLHNSFCRISFTLPCGKACRVTWPVCLSLSSCVLRPGSCQDDRARPVRLLLAHNKPLIQLLVSFLFLVSLFASQIELKFTFLIICVLHATLL